LGPYAAVVTAVLQLGLATFLTLYFIIKAGPAERRAAAAQLLQALKEQREDHERWKKEDREATTALVQVLGNVQGEVIREIKDILSDHKDKIDGLVQMVDNGFKDVMRHVQVKRGGAQQ
jgi:uncharacterized coiled-coil DUF342 family protein